MFNISLLGGAKKAETSSPGFFVMHPVVNYLEIKRESRSQVALIRFIEDAKVGMSARQSGLVFHRTIISPGEIKFKSASEISGEPLAFQKVDIQEKGNLESRQARPVYVPDPSHEIDPLVVPAEAGERSQSKTGICLTSRCDETVHAGIDSHMEYPVVLPH